MIDRDRAWLAADILLLAAVPTALLAVFALPLPVRRSLAFSYMDPTPVTAYTAHFVHLEVGHLLSNLGGYLLVAPTAYLLARIRGSEMRFRVVLIATLVGLPFALSALNVVLVRPRVGYGASGIVSGLFSLLSLELFGYVRAALRPEISRWWAAVVFFVDAMLIAAVMMPRAEGAWLGAVVGCVVVLTYAVELGRELASVDDLWRPWVTRPGYTELGVGAGILVLAFPVLAFPRVGTGNGTVLNLYAHFLGFSLTFIAAYVLPAIDDVESVSDAPTGESDDGFAAGHDSKPERASAD
ncbi:rhomboid family intramembrane serine protease [Halobaculum sp. WSA2]|uniref:Rhomboid family intramembrane serine protease n=1 Tax=Halobaculum saliterrae TaxID=2073113 RepID=A0A6B0SWS2_9EURY|nr:rhomboid family intramembrane serine protease [Halobaculum saliterrae]MXR40702.1 rhomboid family intramembrane serine protease [Halobaculum saliterrae]